MLYYFSHLRIRLLRRVNKEVVFNVTSVFEVEKVNNVSDKGFVISGNVSVTFTHQKTIQRLYSLARSIHEGR